MPREQNEHKPIPATAEGADQVAAELGILGDYLRQFGDHNAREVVRAVVEWAGNVRPLLPTTTHSG